MSLSQLHYTSAPPGPEGSGFRFTAVTRGVTQSVLREAEQIIGYEPPRETPARPTDTELALFPKSFTYSTLSDGSRLLARTVYTGADYSGRWGNFHAHAVHLPPGTLLPGGVLPITAWDSPAWAGSTPGSAHPERLDSLPPSGFLDRRGLVEFALSRGPWLAAVFTDLKRQAEDENAPQIVLVERDSADVARWIALASTVLPRGSAHQLTFTTYTRRPRLARQRIIGVLPDDARELRGHETRYRVYDCGGPPPDRAGAEADPWAQAAAGIWLHGAPELFGRAAALPGTEPFAAGPPAVAVLCAGATLDTHGRTAAADWARTHSGALGDGELPQLIRSLALPADDRSAAEILALAGLLHLFGDAPAETVAPLAALLLVEAVRAPGPAPAPVHRIPLTDELARQLATELSPDLRKGIAGGTGADSTAMDRQVRLLHIAGLLGVDCADLLPGLARRLAVSLLADPCQTSTGAIRDALDQQPGLRTALFEKLDTTAAGDPTAVSRLLGQLRLPLPLDDMPAVAPALPLLRMCDAVSGTPTGAVDRVGTLHTLLRTSGASLYAEPLVLRTAVRLVWPDREPTASEAQLVLVETGPEPHLAAGTWPLLVDAALKSPAEDHEAAELAHELLRCFPQELEPRVRASLLLLEFARDLRMGSAGTGWADRALALRHAARPVESGVLGQALDALALHLVTGPPTGKELDALIRSGDADLCAAYGRAARTHRVRERLRTSATFAAGCFVGWNAHPQASGAWAGTRAGLLDDVLRPVVRAMTDAELAAVETSLASYGGHRLDDFRAWNRPGALGRLGLRFGRSRRQTKDAPGADGTGQPNTGGGRV